VRSLTPFCYEYFHSFVDEPNDEYDLQMVYDELCEKSKEL
jgi:hypothetical protein